MRLGGLLTFIVVALVLGACASSPDVAPDSGPADARPSPDAEIVPDAAPGNFGEACTGNSDCATGYCVEGAGGGGGLCSRECADDCPDDWNCRTVELPGGDTVELCIPEAQYHCARCSGDSECPGGGCLAIDGEDHCAAACASGTDCPGGYACAADPEATHAGLFCIPVTGSCTCDAANAGLTRTCSNTNGIGTCFGMETCNATEGWEGCDARVPSTEDCDGVDDDCDFVIDDGVGGGGPCDITNGFGTCVGVETCTGVTPLTCSGPTPAAERCNFIDDDCNDQVDETFTDLGDTCTAGAGACLRYGAKTCNSVGDGTQCSAVAGTGSAEQCNSIDDDCSNGVDEDWQGPTGLGSQCGVSTGVCARQGTTICNMSGSGTACSASPGSPTGTDSSSQCNYADDDCDGTVDENNTNLYAGTRVYDRNATCGSCEINCATLYGGANATGTCTVGGTNATCQMTCTAGHANLNGSTLDGCEFTPDPTVIYVSASNGVNDATCGLGPNSTELGTHACASITYGRSRATTTVRANIWVADGTYDISGGDAGITLFNGKNLFGGYRSDTWARHALTVADPSATVIQGYATIAATNHQYAIDASGITTATVIDGFVIRGPNNSLTGGNSYAIYSSGSTALTIRNNQIRAGRGGPGGTGNAGTVGTFGANATAPTASYDSFTASGAGSPSYCPSASNRQYPNGGVRSCGTDDVSGGNGSGNTCPAVNTYLQGTSCTTQPSMCNGFTGQSADPGGGAAGAGRAGGNDGVLSSNGSTCFKRTGYCGSGTNNGTPCSSNAQCTGGGTCQVVHPTTGLQWTQSGFTGSPGNAGGDAPGVQGCSLASQYGSVPGAHWTGGPGSTGSVGYNGGGGGGGGAGGGAYCTGAGCDDVVGAHGGGGGSGGCGGSGGLGGSPGGAAFGIFVVGGSAPTISNNAIESGTGGDGGRGGIAGAGGVGGNGSNGGGVGTSGIGVHCSGSGGRGGDGGMGGAGSGGGGGCGGVSYGIFTSGIGAQTYCVSLGGTNAVTNGVAGAGGAGGYSPGVSGGNGNAGVAGDCRSI